MGIKTILYEGMSFRTCFEVYILNYEQQHSMNHHSLMLLSFKSGENGQSRGSGYSSSSATETRLEGSGGLASASGSDTQNLNVIFGAAVGPGDYHGTMSKAELEREAGGRIFTSENSETRNQVETTRYQGSRSSGGASGDAFGRGRGSGGSNQEALESEYASRGGQRGQGYNSGSSRQASGEAYQGSSGTYGAGGGGSVHYEEGSYYDQSNRAKYSGSGSSDYSASSSSTSSPGKCKYVWSDQNNRWECEGSDPALVTDHGSSDSGWVTLPDGTQRRSQSSWSSWNSTSGAAVDGGRAAGGAGRRRLQGGKARRRGQGVRVEAEEDEEGQYLESGQIAEGKCNLSCFKPVTKMLQNYIEFCANFTFTCPSK